jgi:KH domain
MPEINERGEKRSLDDSNTDQSYKRQATLAKQDEVDSLLDSIRIDTLPTRQPHYQAAPSRAFAIAKPQGVAPKPTPPPEAEREPYSTIGPEDGREPAARVASMRILITAKEAGVVIGKQGKHINEMREQTQVKVYQFNQGGYFRTCTRCNRQSVYVGR